jgi:diaminopimelate epimerase
VRLPIFKYTSCGNNFVILDEISGELLCETKKPHFAYYATNQNFGVGCDNFLVLQACTAAVLKKINAVHRYWDEIPDPNSADYIFRMFEADGTEAYSCGNGLMSIANHLFHYSDIGSSRILTEIPTSKPTIVTIGTDIRSVSNWANMAPPRRVPDALVAPFLRTPFTDAIDIIDGLSVHKIRQSDKMRFFLESPSLDLKSYLVFTGEPHLVILCPDGFKPAKISDQIFHQSNSMRDPSKPEEKRIAAGTAFVDFIGKYFVREFSHLFPVGINLNFIRLATDGKAIEHRCFERGINHETLACGTGSLASAMVVKALNLIEDDKITIRPHRCRWTIPEAEIVVEKLDRTWLLSGKPKLLFSGAFHWE